MKLVASIVLLTTGSLAIAQERSPFERWDKNQDGKLSRDELPEPARKNFEKADQDADGWLSPAEDAAFRNRNRNRLRSRDWVKPTPPGTISRKDLGYAHDGHARQKLDLLLPKERSSQNPLPVIAFIHGGGWRQGDKSTGIGRLAPFVAGGEFAGVSIGYRLSGDATWPAQIHDCKAAIRWIRANAAKYNLDPGRIGVWGSSAGGHLASMLGVSGEIDGLEGRVGNHLDQESRVACVVDFFGPSDLLTMGDHPSKIAHNAAGSPESLLVGGMLQKNPDRARSASPLTHVTGDDAPALIVHGTADELVPFAQSVDLHQKLVAAGVRSNLITIDGGGHGDFGNSSDEVQRLVRTFFECHLKGSKNTEIIDRTLESE